MILGLTGTNGSGKTSAADYLQQRGYLYLSLSDEIRTELDSRKLPPTREHLMRVGNELRADFGADVLARRVREKLLEGQDYVVDSIRNPSEVVELRKLEGFRLVHFDAPREVRFERVVGRSDERTPLSFEEFTQQEDLEMESSDEKTQQLLATFALADETLVNEGSLEQLQERVDRVLKIR
jgi:dephospho-CoA kinase